MRVYGFDKPIPKFVYETLLLGPHYPIIDRFNEKDLLSELDCFLNFCHKHCIPDKKLTGINIKTVHCKKKFKKKSLIVI